MERGTVFFAVALVSVSGLGGTFAQDADVDGWREKLADPAGDPSERRRARVALEALAGGSLDDPVTREANFALAQVAAARPDELDSTAALRPIAAATALYPGDPRTRSLSLLLARTHLRLGDPMGAYLAFDKLFELVPDIDDPVVLAQASFAAATVEDFDAALEWSSRVDPAALPADAVESWLLARLRAGEGLRRYDIGVAAARRLSDEFPESLKYDRGGLLAAARVFEATGLAAEAIEAYRTYVDLYPAAPDHTAVHLHVAELLVRTGRTDEANAYLVWLTEEKRDTTEAVLGRLLQLEIEEPEATLAQIDTYVSLIRGAETVAAGRAAASRFADRFVAAGHVVEMMSALAVLTRDDGRRDGALSRMIAMETARGALESALYLTHARNDDPGLAAISLLAEEMGLEIPAARRAEVDAVRLRMGLPTLDAGPLEAAIARAGEAIDAGDWETAVELLAGELAEAGDVAERVRRRAVELLAVALWRAGRADEALLTLRDARESGGDSYRPFVVLEADILYAGGEPDRACPLYEQAASIAPSQWVEGQRARCRPAEENS